MSKQLRIATLGYGFMGRAHSNAWLQVSHFFPGRTQAGPEGLLRARRLRRQDQRSSPKRGATSRSRLDWQKVVVRNDIDLIDICVPNILHHEIVLAAAEAGKMVVCEKPLAMNVAEGRGNGRGGRKGRRGQHGLRSTTAACRPSRWPSKSSTKAASAGRSITARPTTRTTRSRADVPQGGLRPLAAGRPRGRLRRDRRPAGPFDRHGRMAQRPDPPRRGPHRDVRQGAEARRDGQASSR